jgi:hypothetical protein
MAFARALSISASPCYSYVRHPETSYSASFDLENASFANRHTKTMVKLRMQTDRLFPLFEELK